MDQGLRAKTIKTSKKERKYLMHGLGEIFLEWKKGTNQKKKTNSLGLLRRGYMNDQQAMKRSSISLTIREMQIKATVRYHYKTLE